MYGVPRSMPAAGRSWWRIITSLMAFGGIGLIATQLGIDVSHLWAPNRRISFAAIDYALLLLLVVVPLLLAPVTLLRLKYPLRAGVPRRRQGFRLALSILFWLGFLDVLGVCALIVVFWNIHLG
ncbi:MAG TPA: hypothetical protein VD886_17555 [Herpetosiphonaceae bacterium]|nr:hypothetical protein [Herpetosiphonaceae bacterium]